MMSETSRDCASHPPHARWVIKLGIFSLVLVAIVVIPFILFGDSFESWTKGLIGSAGSAAAVAAVGILLLIGDVLLPIPSSVVASVLGATLGLPLGLISAAVGLTLGCAVGYGLGRWLGYGFAKRQIGGTDFEYMLERLHRYGPVLLILCRPVPVLAEASIIAAGVIRMPAGTTLLVTGLANVGVAAVYVGLGAAAEGLAGLALAFAAAILIPAIILLVAKLVRQKSAGTSAC